MGNVTLPAPVAVAGGALCVLAGLLVGLVVGSDTEARATAEVDSYDTSTNELCLRGEAVEELPEAEDGVLCGVWRHGTAAGIPEEGDRFRFVTLSNEDADAGERAVVIYGDVAR